MKGVYALGNLREIFPEFIAESLQEGIWALAIRFRALTVQTLCFPAWKAVRLPLSGFPEMKNFSVIFRGFIPAAREQDMREALPLPAMDGLRVAEAICKNYVNFR